MSAAALVESGILPDAGAWQDQPATFVQAFPILSRALDDCRKAAIEADVASNRRKTKR